MSWCVFRLSPLAASPGIYVLPVDDPLSAGVSWLAVCGDFEAALDFAFTVARWPRCRMGKRLVSLSETKD